MELIMSNSCAFLAVWLAIVPAYASALRCYYCPPFDPRNPSCYTERQIECSHGESVCVKIDTHGPGGGYQPGYQSGSQGYQSGSQGYQSGYQSGSQGYQPGYQPGYQSGSQGYQPGYQSGYQQPGYQSGYQSGGQGYQPGYHSGQQYGSPGYQSGGYPQGYQALMSLPQRGCQTMCPLEIQGYTVSCCTGDLCNGAFNLSYGPWLVATSVLLLFIMMNK